MSRRQGGDADADRFLFVHVQKTAGTSMRRQLIHQFGETAVYPDASDEAGAPIDSVISTDHLERRWQARSEEIRVVTGHFPLCVAERLGGGFRTFTLLREPVARTVSFLRHHRRVEHGPDSSVPLEDLYDDPVRFEGLVHNHMVKMFSLEPAEMTGGVLTPVVFDDARLERAKANLAGVDVVGIQERYGDFLGSLRSQFGWLHLGAPATLNRTSGERARPGEEISAALRARIKQDNAFDAELYEYARSALVSD